MGDKFEGVRRRNLSAVLELVHHGHAVSRAELTAATGLNRSTIAALVAELASLGLVLESAPTASNRVGRPSPRVHPDPGPAVIAINPELDAVSVAVVGLGASVEHRVRREVDHPIAPHEAVELIADLVRETLEGAARDRRIAGIGLAVPGLVRASDGLVRWAPHLGWRELPLTRLVEDAVGLPTVAGNDASLGARAERTFGAGRGVDDLVYLNGGASGIGGGIILGGRTVAGVGGYAGEFGHTFSTDAGAALEDVVNRARLTAALGIAAPTDTELERALRSSADPAVATLIDEQVRTLGRGLAGTINILNPECILLGGFLGVLGDLAPDVLLAAVRERTLGPALEDVRIARAELGEDLLMIGAAELAFERLLANPLDGLSAPATFHGSAPTLR